MLQNMKNTRIIRRNCLESDGKGLILLLMIQPHQFRPVFPVAHPVQPAVFFRKIPYIPQKKAVAFRNLLYQIVFLHVRSSFNFSFII